MYFCFVSFVLNVIVFVYKGLKQSLIQQTKSNRLLHIYFFLRILRFILKQHLVLYVQTYDLTAYEFAVMFVTFICLSYLHRHGSLNRETFLVSREQKLTKFVYFLKIMMYENSIFLIKMMACISLVVNSVLFRFGFMPGILRQT